MLKNIMKIEGAMQLSKYEQRMLKGGWDHEEGCYQLGDLCCIPTVFGRDSCGAGSCIQGIVCDI